MAEAAAGAGPGAGYRRPLPARAGPVPGARPPAPPCGHPPRPAGPRAGRAPPGARYLAGRPRCAADLALFGPGSLFELLCTARPRAGEDTLAAWLLSPAGPEEVRARQEAVAELRGQLDLREHLALVGAA